MAEQTWVRFRSAVGGDQVHVCREWIAAVDVAVRDGKQVKGTSCILLVGGGGLLVAGTPAETLAVLRRVEAKDGQV